MKGVRIAAWGAGGAVAAGSAAVALVAAMSPGHHSPGAIGGATYADIADGSDARLVVTSLRTGGAEASGGLRVGDAVMAVDGIARPSLGALRRQMANPRAVVLTIERGGDAIPLTLQPPRETRFDEDPAGRGR